MSNHNEEPSLEPCDGQYAVTPRVRALLDAIGAKPWQRSDPEFNLPVSVFRDQHGAIYMAHGRDDLFQYAPLLESLIRLDPDDDALRPAEAIRERLRRIELFVAAASEAPVTPLAARRCWRDGALLYDLNAWDGSHVRVEEGRWTIAKGGVPCFRCVDKNYPSGWPVGGYDLWSIMERWLPASDMGTRLLVAALVTGALNPRLETPWPLLLSDLIFRRTTWLLVIKSLIDPTPWPCMYYRMHPAQVGFELTRQMTATFANVDLASGPVIDALVSHRSVACEPGDMTDRPWVVLSGVEAPIYDPRLVSRCLPIEVPDFPSGFRTSDGIILGAMFDTLSQPNVFLAEPDESWAPEGLARFAGHGKAIAVAFGQDPSSFETALAERVAFRATITKAEGDLPNGDGGDASDAGRSGVDHA